MPFFQCTHPISYTQGRLVTTKLVWKLSQLFERLIFPWCERISQAFTQKLVEKPLWGKFFIDFDYKEALLGDVDGAG